MLHNEPRQIILTYTFFFSLTDIGHYIHSVHCSFNCCTFPEHLAWTSSDRWIWPGQWQSSTCSRWSRVYCMVYNGVSPALPVISNQVEILQRATKCHWLISYITLLRHYFSDRVEQKRAAVPEREEGGADIPYHENIEDSEVGKTFNRTTVSWIYPQAQLQWAWLTNIVLSHGNHDILKFGLLCREGWGCN